MFQPEELKKNEPLLWSAGTGTEVWELFCACAAGDLETVERLIGKNPSLVGAHYEYRTPLYFAVRENQMAVAIFLLDHGANPFYNGDDLVEMARIRGLADMETLIESKRAGQVRRNQVPAGIWTGAYLGNIEQVREFLDHDPSLVNQPGRTDPALRLFSQRIVDTWK